MPSKLTILLLVPIVLVARHPAVGAAPEEPVASSGRPWAENVPQERQERALLLYDEANKLFEDSQHAAALAKYREALKAWDHPAIHYNAAVALIYLDQPLEAYENLEASLRYGSAPFSGDTYQQALTYQKLLRGQLAELKVMCAEERAEVTLDGRSLFIGPGESAKWVLPGPHQLVARKAGFLSDTRSLNLLPGRPSSERLTLEDIRSLPIKTVRRWPAWKPWTVVGAGVLIALVGVPFILDAKSNVNAYDAQVAASCSTGTGCPAGSISQASLDRGHLENTLAISFFSVGAAVAASGAALLIFNQPRVAPLEERTRAQLAPLLGPGTIGLSVAFLR